METNQIAASETQMNQPGNFREKIRQLNSLLVVAFGFIMPMWVAPTNILAGLILLLWLIQGDYRADFEKVRNNKLVWAVSAFVTLNFVGFLWTSDVDNGWQVAGRESLLMLIPLFMMVLRDEHVNAAIGSFMASMMLSAILSIMLYLGINTAFFVYDCPQDFAPFMSHISYTPYLVIAAYISLYTLLLDQSASWQKKTLSAIIATAMAVVIFISNGRAGQVMFFMMIGLIIFQYYNKQLLRALILAVVSIPLIIFIAYKSSDRFSDRITDVIEDVNGYSHNSKSAGATGQRIIMARNAIEIIRKHPIIGVGTGDFKSEFAEVAKRNTPGYTDAFHPHNMYLLELAQFGIIGLASILWILYSQIRLATSSSEPLPKYFGLALPVLFAVIMFSDSYLLGHFTTVLFIYFSAILYHDHA
ncbi:MAG: O-antigen ligase family protein [Chlorobiaceae bacterium]|nr:O-antigen ligase family protein [Chlorobiaceae bacterium]